MSASAESTELMESGAGAGSGKALADLVSTDDAFAPVFDALRDIAAESLKILIPVESHLSGLRPTGKYNSLMHARLCRLRMLGLSDGESAKSLGVTPSTIKAWRHRYPKLADDMDTAASLGNAHAAAILQGLMRGGGPTAFQAVRFYLTTHCTEFAEKQRFEVSGDVKHTMSVIRANLYGLIDEREPILDAEAVAIEADGKKERPAALVGSVSGDLDALLPLPLLDLDL